MGSALDRRPERSDAPDTTSGGDDSSVPKSEDLVRMQVDFGNLMSSSLWPALEVNSTLERELAPDDKWQVGHELGAYRELVCDPRYELQCSNCGKNKSELEFTIIAHMLGLKVVRVLPDRYTFVVCNKCVGTNPQHSTNQLWIRWVMRNMPIPVIDENLVTETQNVSAEKRFGTCANPFCENVGFKLEPWSCLLKETVSSNAAQLEEVVTEFVKVLLLESMCGVTWTCQQPQQCQRVCMTFRAWTVYYWASLRCHNKDRPRWEEIGRAHV